jgi:di/tricarboxylate transporter
MSDYAWTWQGGTTIGIILLSFTVMALEIAPPDMIMIGALILMIPLGIITPSEAIAGFSQRGLLTVMVLFAVAEGLQRTGAFDIVRNLVVPKRGARTTPPHELIVRFVVPTVFISAFLNNTPLVALMIPTVRELALASGVPVSKLLIPLSYAAIAGGTCTLIGTSTNLVLSTLAEAAVLKRTGEVFVIGFFDIAVVGLPVALAIIFFLIALSGFILPSRDLPPPKERQSRVFHVSSTVQAGSLIIGKTVDETGFSMLASSKLELIIRGTRVHVEPFNDEPICAGDVLVFAGGIEGVVELTRSASRNVRQLLDLKTVAPLELEPEAAAGRYLPASVRAALDRVMPAPRAVIVEVVLSARSRAIDLTSSAFGAEFGVSVIAVARADEGAVAANLAEQTLRKGDSLLLLTTAAFLRRFRDDVAFSEARELEQYAPPRLSHGPFAFVSAIGMLIISIMIRDDVDLLTAALFCVGAMLATGCLTPEEARASFRLDLYFVIGAAFGLSTAMLKSGAAIGIASVIISVGGANFTPVVFMLYLVTSLLTEVITNNAAVALMVRFRARSTRGRSRRLYWPSCCASAPPGPRGVRPTRACNAGCTGAPAARARRRNGPGA